MAAAVESAFSKTMVHGLAFYSAFIILCGIGFFEVDWHSLMVFSGILLGLLAAFFFLLESPIQQLLISTFEGLNTVGLMMLFGHFSADFAPFNPSLFPLPESHWLYYLALAFFGAIGHVCAMYFLESN